MGALEYIRIDRDILEMNFCDKAKMLLGLVRSFDSRGLLMTNAELGNLLSCSSDHIGRLLQEIGSFIQIENARSRYRKIFYSGKNAGVDGDLLRQEGRSSSDSTPALAQSTPAKMPDITKGTNGTKGTEGKKERKRKKPVNPTDPEDGSARQRKSPQPTRFVKPTVQEVLDYAKSIGYQVDAEAFCDFYESKGWKIGKNPMKDWKASVRTWQRREMHNGENHHDRTHTKHKRDFSQQDSSIGVTVHV